MNMETSKELMLLNTINDYREKGYSDRQIYELLVSGFETIEEKEYIQEIIDCYCTDCEQIKFNSKNGYFCPMCEQ